MVGLKREAGFLLAEVMPALLMVICAVGLSARALVLHARWSESLRMAHQSVEALSHVQFAWLQKGGRGAVAYKQSGERYWQVAVMPGSEWIPATEAQAVPSAAARSTVTVWRRTPEVRAGLNGWVIEQRHKGLWREQLWVHDPVYGK